MFQAVSHRVRQGLHGARDSFWTLGPKPPNHFTPYALLGNLAVLTSAVATLASTPSNTVTARGFLWGTDMTGRPGYRTMEMIGGSSAPYLARTPCVPLFCTSFNRVGNKERFRLPGAGGGSFPLYGGTFARSYSVSIL